MNTVIAADFDPGHAARGHGLAAGLFITIFFVGGLILVVKAFRLLRKRHDPHATRYAHRKH